MQTVDPTVLRNDSRSAAGVAEPRRRSRLGAGSSLVPGWTIGGAWLLAYVVVGAVAPPADPAYQMTILDIVLANLLLAGIMLSAAGLTTRSILAGAGAVLGGGVFAFGSVTCWWTGHVGTWIAVQFAAGLALAMLGAVALATSRR